MPSSSQQRMATFPPTHYQNATRQYPPRTVRSGAVNLVDAMYPVQPNMLHVQQSQYQGNQVVQPSVQFAHQPQHHFNPYPFQQYQANQPRYHPNQGVPPHQQQPPRHQNQARRHREPITRLANEYRAATLFHGASRPPATHNQANQFRPPGPHATTDQHHGRNQYHNVRPRGQIQGPGNSVPGSFRNPPQTVEDTPPYPPGLYVPSANPQMGMPPPPPPDQRSDVRGDGMPRQITHRRSQGAHGPPRLPAPSMFDVRTPKPRVTSVVDNDRTPRAVPQSDRDDSSSEGRTDVDSIDGAFSSVSGHATSITSGSERCITPPYSASQSMLTPKAEQPLNENMQVAVAGYVNKYKQDGLDPLLIDLMLDGTRDYRRCVWIAKAARSVFEQLRGEGFANIERLEQALRFEALRQFKAYWSAVSLSSLYTQDSVSDLQFIQDGEWKTYYDNFVEKPFYALRGVNLAGLVGSLFNVSFVNADDVHMCLDLLVVNPMRLHFICAMHALIIHCDERLCVNEHWPGTSRFCAKMTAHNQSTRDVNCEDYDDIARVLINVSWTFVCMVCAVC